MMRNAKKCGTFSRVLSSVSTRSPLHGAQSGSALKRLLDLGHHRNNIFSSVLKASTNQVSSQALYFTSSSRNIQALFSRQFASTTFDDNDDGVEARLMGDDDAAAAAAGTDYDMADMDYDAYNEEQVDSWEGQTSAKSGEAIEGMMAQKTRIVADDDHYNDPSDEELEGGTDEELEELLANAELDGPPVDEVAEGSTFAPEGEDDDDDWGPEVYSFRPEGPVFYPGMTYDPEDLDISRPYKPRERPPRQKLTFSVQEVIDKADFRNVRFLTKFISETGTIRARKEFDMRNKSHNRITKAIKTARFFGLMPYSNMGRPKFVFNQPFDEMADFYEKEEGSSEASGPAQDRVSNRGTFAGRWSGPPGRQGGPLR